MWVRRALQRAEPGAQQGFKGDPRTGLLGEGFAFHPKKLFYLRAERPEGEARRSTSFYNSYLLDTYQF
jgi:hypothetical protein